MLKQRAPKLKVHRPEAIKSSTIEALPEMRIMPPPAFHLRTTEMELEGQEQSGFSIGSAPQFEPSHALDTKSADVEHQLLASGNTGGAMAPELPTTGGHSLPEKVRLAYEETLGISLGDVILHDDAASHKAAKELGAEAFAHGLHIYFGGKGYKEGDPRSEKILAHELLHVKQYKQGRVPDAEDQAVSSPHDPLEAEAYGQENTLAKASLEARGAQVDTTELNQSSSVPSLNEKTDSGKAQVPEAEDTLHKKPLNGAEKAAQASVAGEEDGNEKKEAPSSKEKQGAEKEAKGNPSTAPQGKKTAEKSVAVAEEKKAKSPLGIESADVEGQHDAKQKLATEGEGSSSTTALRVLANEKLEGFHARAGVIQDQLKTAAETARTQVIAAFLQSQNTLEAKAQGQCEAIDAAKTAEIASLRAHAQAQVERYHAGRVAQIASAQAHVNERKQAAIALGEQQAKRAAAESEIDAKQAFALAGTFQLGGDPELVQSKRKALNAIAQDAAHKIRNNGKDVARKARELAHGFASKLDEVFARFVAGLDAETANQEAAALQFARKAEAKLEAAAAQAKEAVQATLHQGIAALQSEQAEAIAQVDGRLGQLSKQATQLVTKVDATFHGQVSDALDALEEASSGGESQEPASEGAENEQESEKGADIAEALASASNLISNWADATFADLDAIGMETQESLAQLAAQATERAVMIATGIGGQMEQGATAVQEAMHHLSADMQQQVSEATDELLDGHGQACKSFSAELEKQFADGATKLDQLVTDGLQGGKNLLAELPGHMGSAIGDLDQEYTQLKTEANSKNGKVSKRILRSFGSWLEGVTESMRSWMKDKLGDVLGDIVAALVQVVVILVVGSFAIGALIVFLAAFFVTGPVAVAIGVMVGLFAAVALGINNRFNEFDADNEEGVSILQGVGLSVLGILDITGIPYIIEGIVGQRAYGAEMTTFERAERATMGTAFLAIGIFSAVKGVKGARARGGAPVEVEAKPKVRTKQNIIKPAKKEYRPGRSARRDMERRAEKNAKKKLSPPVPPKVGKHGKQKLWNSGKHSFNGLEFNRKSSPIKIPKFATVVEQIKTGYTQVKYTWTEGGKKFEARWHTKTPGAPAGQGDTWVITRKTPSPVPGAPAVEHVLVENGKWVRMIDWSNAGLANRAGSATPAQQLILENGHHPAY